MNIVRGLGIWVLLLGLFLGVYLFLDKLGIGVSRILSIIILFMPIWLPYITFHLFFNNWLGFVRYQNALKGGRSTIEIFLPQEIFKSPLAMELVLTQLFQTAGADNHIQTYWDGKHPPTFSLELISTHGNVRLLINTPSRFKNLIESQLYAQYPGIEIKELEHDYTAEIPENGVGYSSFMVHNKLRKPDAYPILTYFDYGLQANPKEEEKIDPISITLETLSTLGPGEHMWFQILIKANRGYKFIDGYLHPIKDWKDSVKGEIEGIIKNAKARVQDDEGGGGGAQLSEGERDNLKALERSLSKYAFDTYIRSAYIAKNDSFNGMRIPAMIAAFRGTDSVSRNQIGPIWVTDTQWPWWQDRGGRKTAAWKRSEIEDFKTRRYTERTRNDTGMVLTTEELATLFHLPGSVVLSPNVQRIGSLRSEAPGNLPI